MKTSDEVSDQQLFGKESFDYFLWDYLHIQGNFDVKLDMILVSQAPAHTPATQLLSCV